MLPSLTLADVHEHLAMSHELIVLILNCFKKLDAYFCRIPTAYLE